MELRIVPATDGMIEQVLRWLEIEYKNNGEGFFANADLGAIKLGRHHLSWDS